MAATYQKPTVGGSTNTWGTELNNYLDAVKQGINVKEYGAVGDGVTDDTAAIQAALDAAHIAGGGVIFFPEGTYLTDQLSVYSNTILTGTGNGSVLKLSVGAEEQHLLFIGDGEEYITIQILKLDGNRANNAYNYSKIIQNYGGNYVTVQNCHVTSGYSDGIWFAHGAINCRAINNYVDDCGNGIKVASNGTIISGNTVINCGTTGIWLESSATAGHNDGVICSGNYVDGKDTTTYGIRLGGGIFAGDNVHIINNTIIDCVNHGISTTTSDDEAFNNILIQGNVCTGHGINGISITPDAAHTFLNSTISGNICNDNGNRGMYLTYLKKCIVSNNVCSSNGAGDTYSGILITGDSTESSFQNNICNDNTDHGIEETATCSSNLISNNYTLDNTNAEIDSLGTNTIVRHNIGWTTENSGIATLLNSNTTIVVAHGLSAVPAVINIAWRENPTNAIGDWWVDTIGATNFTLNGVDPGASNLDFGWEAKVR